MIKNFCIGIFLLLQLLALGQEESKNYRRYFSKDQFSFALTSSQLMQKRQVIHPGLFSRGVDLRMLYPVIGNNSNVAFALGFGFAGQNYYLDEYVSFNNDSIWFTQIPDTINFKKYKLSTNYLTLPVELRFRTNPRGTNRKSFKFYPGFRAGVLVNVHTKYIGRDLKTNDRIKEKEYNQKHISFIDYGPTFRLGYGKIMLHGYYSLVGLIDNKGLQAKPFELGISIILF